MEACIIFKFDWDIKGFRIKIKGELQIYVWEPPT
jgi:hypothetical protein